MKKTLIIISILLVAAGVAWWYISTDSASKDKKEAKEQYQLVQVKRGPIRVIVEATGRVVPEQEVEIKCKASGQVIKLPKDVSDPVKKGDLLIQLDPDDETRSVKRAEVALSASQAKLAQARLNLQIAERNLDSERIRAASVLKSEEAQVQEAKSKLERTNKLLDKGMASREEIEAVQTSHAQAVKNLEDAHSRIDDLKTKKVEIDAKQKDVEIAETQVKADTLSLSDAQQRLKDTTVVAPIDGVVSDRPVQVGQIIASGINNVGGGTTVLSLADLSHVYVLVAVDESDIGKIKAGQHAQIMVDAHQSTIFFGQVVRVATKGSITSNVVTFEVKVEVTGENRRLLMPEMTANVEIAALEKKDVLLVPVNALERKRYEYSALVQKNKGKPEQRAVKVGVSDGEFIEIVSGLDEGEEIIVSPESVQEEWQADKDKNKGKKDKTVSGHPH